MQLSSEPHDVLAPSRAGCCCGVICAGALWPPLAELGRVTVLLLQLQDFFCIPKGQDRPDPFCFLGQGAAASGLGFTSP